MHVRLRSAEMDDRKPNDPRAPVLSTQGRRPDSAAGTGSQGGADSASSISRSADALQRARDQRPKLGTLIHLATGSREQLDLFAWSARDKPAAPALLQDAAVEARPGRPAAAQPPVSARCPSCGAALGTGDEAHSMTGDALADHLLDYHEGELGSAEVSYRRRKEQARCRAQELRRGSVRTGVKTCT